MPNFIADTVIAENHVDTINYSMRLSTQATSVSTLILTTLSSGNQQFTGATAGQIVNLGNATTYLIGHEWWIINDSTTSVLVRDNSAVLLVTLLPTTRAKMTLKDNSSSAGVWILTIASTVATIPGGLFIANYSSTANSNSNNFLNTFGVGSSDNLPAVTPISGTISRVTIMLSNSLGTGTLEFRVNTAVGTPAFTATITTAQTTTVAVSYVVNANDRINCKVAAGASGMAKPLVNIYM